MATKPTPVFTWATNANYAASSQPWASSPTKVQPPSGVIAEGHNPEEPCVAEYENWAKNKVGEWVTYLDAITGPTQAVFIARQVLTAASGTYTPTAGTQKVLLRMCAGGGGAGGAKGAVTPISAYSGGGGSGENVELWIDPAATITGGAFAVGAAGAAGTSTPGNGGNGGDSTIVIQGVTYTAKGGLGSGAVTGTGAPQVALGGGAQTTGALTLSGGQPGQPGVTLSNAGVGYSGNGGSTPFGAGGLGVINGSAGNNGTGRGAGGSGAGSINASGFAGGAGTAGVIIIDEFR
jgi:hypothetical protein